MRILPYLILFSSLMACKELNTPTENSPEEIPTVIRETSPTARFEHFVATFPTAKLPFVLGEMNSFDRMEEEYIEHILMANKHAEVGLDKSANCIGTFKVGNNIAVLYQWMVRPTPANAAMHYELAVYTPYGALKGSQLLGVNQNSHEEFQETLNFRIDATFKITTEHHLEYYVDIENEGAPAFDVYTAFFTNEYQIREDGSIEQLKKANLWEKVPHEFTAAFVESFKKEPQRMQVDERVENGRVVLKTTTSDFGQVIFAKIPTKGETERLLVSSLTTEPSSETNTDAFVVYSKLSILEFEGRSLSIVTNKMLDKGAWFDWYKIFKESCACAPSPNVNDQGIIALTAVGTTMLEAIYGDLGPDGSVEFNCLKLEDKETKVIHQVKLDQRVEYEG